MDDWSKAEKRAVAILPKISSLFSLFGSLCIVIEVLYHDRRKLRRVYHRLLLVMSLYNTLESIATFSSTWPIPTTRTSSTFSPAYTMGNSNTCTIQGFIIQFGLSIPILNMCLSVYYLLVIKWSWSEERIRKNAEPWFHLLAVSVALGTALVGLKLDLYGDADLWCWYAPCGNGFEGLCVRDEEENEVWLYRWTLYYGILWFCMLFVIVAMILVYIEVWRLEMASRQHNFESQMTLSTKFQRSVNGRVSVGGDIVMGNDDARNDESSIGGISGGSGGNKFDGFDDDIAGCNDNLHQEAVNKIPTSQITTNDDNLPSQHHKDTHDTNIPQRRLQQENPPATSSKSFRVAIQALWYVGAFFITFIFATINRIVQHYYSHTYFPLMLLHSISEPCQGFLNFCVYIRPRLVKYMEKNPGVSYWIALRRVIFPDDETFRTKLVEYADDDVGSNVVDNDAGGTNKERPLKLINALQSSGIFRIISSPTNAVRSSTNKHDDNGNDNIDNDIHVNIDEGTDDFFNNDNLDINNALGDKGDVAELSRAINDPPHPTYCTQSKEIEENTNNLTTITMAAGDDDTTTDYDLDTTDHHHDDDSEQQNSINRPPTLLPAPSSPSPNVVLSSSMAKFKGGHSPILGDDIDTVHPSSLINGVCSGDAASFSSTNTKKSRTSKLRENGSAIKRDSLFYNISRKKHHRFKSRNSSKVGRVTKLRRSTSIAARRVSAPGRLAMEFGQNFSGIVVDDDEEDQFEIDFPFN